jgi:hypothetical protein
MAASLTTMWPLMDECVIKSMFESPVVTSLCGFQGSMFSLLLVGLCSE